MESVGDYISKHKQRFLDELFNLLKIPSVSADSAFAQDVVDAAIQLEQHGICISSKGHRCILL